VRHLSLVFDIRPQPIFQLTYKFAGLYSGPDKYDHCNGKGELPCRQTMQAALRLRVQFATNLHLPTFQLL